MPTLHASSKSVSQRSGAGTRSAPVCSFTLSCSPGGVLGSGPTTSSSGTGSPGTAKTWVSPTYPSAVNLSGSSPALGALVQESWATWAGRGSTRKATTAPLRGSVGAASIPDGRRPRTARARCGPTAASSAASADRSRARSPCARHTAVQ